MRLVLWLALAACAGGAAPSDDDSDTEGPTPDTDTDTDTTPDCAAIPTFEDGRTPTRELHVAVDGTDDSGDGSAERPYATVRAAARAATPGTAVRIHAGTWSARQWVEDLRGTAEAPIWIGGAPGEDPPVFAGDAEGLHASRVSYLVLHDLVVRDTRDNGINIDDGGAVDDPAATHHVIVRDVHVHDVGGTGNQDCLKLSGLRDYWVLDSTFQRCGGGTSGSGIDHVGCHRGVLARNRIEDTAGSGIQVKGGSADVDIRWNHIVRPGERGVNMGGSTGYAFFRPPLDPDAPNAEASRVRVRGNLFEGGTAALAFVGCDDCEAEHNTIVDPQRWVIRILQETRSDGTYTFVPARNGRMTNDLVLAQRARLSRWINVGDGTDPDSFRFSNELWFAADAPSDVPDLPGTTSGLLLGVDPLVDETFVPGTGSPARGAGAPTDLVGDRVGACFGEPATLGSIEP